MTNLQSSKMIRFLVEREPTATAMRTVAASKGEPYACLSHCSGSQLTQIKCSNEY